MKQNNNNSMDNKLHDQLWSAAREYARQFGDIIGQEVEYCVDSQPSGLWCYGDSYYFSLEDIQMVVDHIDKFVSRYGSREAVGQEIKDWVEWWLDDLTGETIDELVMARVTHQLRPNINLEAWLAGCPRKDREPWSGPDRNYIRLKNDHDTLTRLIKTYRGNRSLVNVLKNVDEQLAAETEAKKKRDEEEYKRIKKTRWDDFYE